MSSSPSLRNRELLKYYFQMLPTDDSLALGFFAIIRKYQWRRVGIIQENAPLYSEVCTYMHTEDELKVPVLQLCTCHAYVMFSELVHDVHNLTWPFRV